MPSLHQALRLVQETDTEIERARQRIRAIQAELADDSAFQAAQASLRQAQDAHQSAERAIREGEQALEKLDRTITLLQTRLYDGSIHSAKEATSVEDELRHRRAERSATEDRVLALMEQLDMLQDAVSRARAGLVETEQHRTTHLSALKAEGRELMARLKTLQEHRPAIASALPPALLSRYERLRTQVRPAVVALQGTSCGGCGVTIPTALRQKLAAGEAIQCPTCYRLLTE